MTEEKKDTFHDAIVRLLGEKLKGYKELNAYNCMRIYQDIFQTFVEVFEPTRANLTNEAMNYLAQQYYDGVLINNTQELDPNIFEQRAKLENIETKELAMLSMLLRGTDFVLPVLEEIRKRS